MACDRFGFISLSVTQDISNCIKTLNAKLPVTDMKGNYYSFNYAVKLSF